MADDPERELDAILARKRAKDEKAAAEAQAHQAREAAEAKRRKEAHAHWKDVQRPALAATAAEINARIEPAGLEIRFRDATENFRPAIARLSLLLFENGRDTGNQIALNVSAQGLIQASLVLPKNAGHSGTRAVDPADPGAFKRPLVDFLNAAV